MKRFIASIIAVCCSYILVFGQETKTITTIRVVFPFVVQSVTLEGYWPQQTINMLNTGPNEYSGQAILSASNELIFNIKYNVVGFEGYYYVAAGNKYELNLIPNRLDAHGIKYAKVFVNNQLISNLYTVRNWPGNGLDISLKLNAYNGIVPFNDADHLHLVTDDRIPCEAHHHHGYLNENLPTGDDNDVAGWIVAMADNHYPDFSKVELDYMRVYGYQGNDSVLLCYQEFNTYNDTNDGGLYLRYPFFPAGHDEHDPLPGSLNGGVLTITPSNHRMKAPHLWTNRYDPPGVFSFDGYKMICRAKVTGHSVIQVGIDFRTASGTVHELGVSDWYFHGNGQWQDIVFDSRSFQTSGSITGKLLFFNQTESPIPDYLSSDYAVQLFENGTAIGSPQIIEQGNSFAFSNLEANKSYQIRLSEQTNSQYLYDSWSWNNWGGVTALDALIISYMAVGSNIVANFPWIIPSPGQGHTPFSFKTADVNSTNSLTANDPLTILYRIVGYPGSNPFPGGKPNFIATAKKQPNENTLTYPNAPDILFTSYGNYQPSVYSNTIYQEATLPPLASGENVFNIYLTATGDINASKGTESTKRGSSSIDYVETLKVFKEEEVAASFYLDGNPSLAAFNLNLEYRTDLIEIIEVKGCKIFRDDPVNGRLLLAWMDSEGKTFGKDTELFKLRIRLKNTVSKDDHLFFIGNGSSWVDPNATEIETLKLVTAKIETYQENVTDLTNDCNITVHPAPFSTSCSIQFEIEEKYTIQLVIYNMTGGIVHIQHIEDHAAGQVYMEVKREDLKGNGSYLYKLLIENERGSNQLLTGKLVMVK